MPDLSANLIEVFQALNSTDTNYVVVGGVAVVLHGHVRLTVDLDIVLDLDSESLPNALTALKDLDLHPRAPVDIQEFADAAKRELWIKEKHMKVFSLFDPNNPLRVVDLFVRDPIDFPELHNDAKRIDLDGTEVLIASIDHLMIMKREAGRPKDQDDLEKLKALKSMQ